jgi:hypothetical protein
MPVFSGVSPPGSDADPASATGNRHRRLMLTSVNIRKHAKDVSRPRIRGAPTPIPNANIRKTPWLLLTCLGFAWLLRRPNLGFPPQQCWLLLACVSAFLGFRGRAALRHKASLRDREPPGAPLQFHSDASEIEIDHVQIAAIGAL